MESVPPITDLPRIEYSCTGSEASETESLIHRQRLGGGSRGRMRIVLLAGFCAMATVFYFQVAPGERGTWLTVFIALWIIVFSWMKLKPNPATKSKRIEIARLGIRIVRSNDDVMIYWLDFTKLLESERLFVLLAQKEAFTLTLPKRVFPDTASQDFFRTVARAEISRCAAVRKSGSLEP